MYIKSLFKRIPSEIFVFLVAFLYRLPSLGYDFINNDAFLWKSRGYAFGSALTSLDFAGTAVIYHPGVTLLWCQFVALKIYSVLTDIGVYSNLSGSAEFWASNHVQTVVVVLFTSVLITIAYSKLKDIVGLKIAALATLLLLVEPFFIALSRTIHTDAIITLLMFIAALYFYSYVYDSNGKLINWNSLLAGVFAGLAFLTKSIALFLIPFFLLVTAVLFFKYKNYRIAYKPFTVLAFGILTFFVVWPAMWVQPIQSLNMYLFEGVQGVAIEEGHEHNWFGQQTADPGPSFYPIVLVGRYTIPLILLSAVSIFFLFKNRKSLLENKSHGLYLSLLLFFIFYILMVTLASKKLDRYSLPVVYPLSVLAAWSLVKLFSDRVVAGVIALIIISRLVLFTSIHPNYLAYYSPLIGGLDKGRYVIEPKWLVGYDEVAKHFNKIQEGESEVLKVAIADYDYLRPFANFEVLNIKQKEERDEAEYFILPVYREERNSFYTDSYNVEKLNDTINIGGVEYYYIYKVLK